MCFKYFICDCPQAQNDEFSAIFNLEDYKGRSCLVVLFSIRFSVCFAKFMKSAYFEIISLQIEFHKQCQESNNLCYANLFRESAFDVTKKKKVPLTVNLLKRACN